MISRRKIIASAVGVSAVATLAACSAGASLENTPDITTSSTDGPVLVGKITDIPIGSGKKFEVVGVPILVTQPTVGEFRGFSAVCTHAGFVMSSMANSEIKCDLHGSIFNANDGSVLAGPAPKALGKVEVTIDGEDVLVSF